MMLTACFCKSTIASAQQETAVTTADFIVSDALTIPSPSRQWQRVSLPHRSVKPTDRDLVGYWYRASFVQQVNEAAWLFFPKLRSGGTVYINGVQADNIPGATSSMQIRWFQPHLIFLSPSSLRAGENEIAVHFAIREPLTSFGEFYVGAQEPMRQAYDKLMFWEKTSTEIVSVTCCLAGILILVFWIRRPQEKLYGVFGACVLFWGIRTFVFRMPEVPMHWWVIWRFFYYLTTAGFITSITIFLLGFSAFRGRTVPYLLIANWLGGSFLFLIIGTPARLFMDAVWILSFLPLTTFAIGRLAFGAYRRPTLETIAMVATVVLALFLAMHDYAVQHGMFGLSEFYFLHLGIPAFLVVMGCVLIDRFVESLAQSETMNERLARSVEAREKELAISYQQLSALERLNATVEERQRIMQDMHDGVGSQLLSTLVLVRRGAASQSATVNLLQDCLDDMRLSIDALSPEEPDLLTILGDFRFRMESRYKLIGLPLRWRNHAMPDSVDIAPHAALQILRILQEALTNIIKHAHAATVDIDVIFSASLIQIRIVDDGIGFVEDVTAIKGRGLANMHRRARKIGATLTFTHTSAGTSVVLDFPI